MKKSFMLLLRLLCFFIHIQPEFVKAFYGWILGVLWFDIFRIRRDLAIENTKIVFPDMTLSQRKKLVRKSLSNMGRAFVDYFSMPFLNKENVDQVFVFEGTEHLKTALEKKKGVMLVSLHLGTYDYAAAAVAQKFQPFYVISKHFNYDFLNRIWFGLRESKGMQFISERKSTFDILRALKKNGLVCFVIDQFMGPPIGVKSKFFGKETGSPMGLAVFSMKTRSPVIPTHSYRKGAKNYLVFGPEIPFEEKGSKDESVLHMTEAYNRWLEEVILKHPEQWMWVHNRWKRFKY